MALTVRSAMLADAATLNQADGKLYIHGGQWDSINTVRMPLRHPSMAIALVLEIPYDEALKAHQFEIYLDLDGERLEAPHIAGELQAGHAPNLAPGASSFAPMAFPIIGLELHKPGRYEWQIKLDGKIASRLPMTVAVMPSPPGTSWSLP